jgi:hypothetical protein
MGTHFIPQDSPWPCQFLPLVTISDILAFLAKTAKCIWNWEWGTIHNFLHQHHGEKAPFSVSLTPQNCRGGGGSKAPTVLMEELPLGEGSQ